MAKHGGGALLLLSGMQVVGGVPPIGGSIAESAPTELPGLGFPGPTAEASQRAWPGGKQPDRFDAWPQVGYGTPNRTLLPCWKKIPLTDHSTGWPGLCLRLYDAKKYTTQEGCRTLCWNEPRCPVWQFVNQTSPGQCWVGLGTDCGWRDGKGSSIRVQAAQRIMHGSVRVLKNLSGWKINNLYQIGMYHSGDERLSIIRCKAWCYSYIGCTYWQYGPGGCWVDAPQLSTDHDRHPEKQVQYPLTTNGGASNTSSEALTMMWGEYIQHYCPPQLTTQAPVEQISPQVPIFVQTTAAPDSSGTMNMWPFFILAVAICLCGGACAYFMMMPAAKGKSVKSKRGARVAMSEYNDEDKPLMLPTQEPRPHQDGRGVQAPTSDYLNLQPNQDPQRPQQPPQRRSQAPYGGGMPPDPDTQNFGDPAGQWYSPQDPHRGHWGGQSPEWQASMPTQAAMPPTQPAMHRGASPYMQQAGMPFPGPGQRRPSLPTMPGMQGQLPRLA